MRSEKIKTKEPLLNESFNIAVVVVLFYPNHINVQRILENLKEDCTRIIFVDNTPDVSDPFINNLSKEVKSVEYIPLFKNYGIAYAQNKGIELAKKIEHISHILFLDQDSVIKSGFAKFMTHEYRRISKNGIDISVLSPLLINSKLKKAYSYKVLKRYEDFLVTDKVSSSGSLISLKTLSIVGLMEEGLFIDLVDSEWCWRAGTYNFKCCVTKKISIEHPIGENYKFFLGHQIIISSPSRYYYQYRNWLKMLSRSYVPIEWKLKTSIRNSFGIIYYPLFIKNGWHYLKYMIRGLKDNFIY